LFCQCRQSRAVLEVSEAVLAIQLGCRESDFRFFAGMVRANGGAPPSVWPSLRQRTAALLRDIYAELITEGAARALSRLPPPASEAVGDAAGCRDEAGESPVLPEMGAASSAALWTLSVLVAGVGSMESRLSSDSLPCRTVREATPLELRANAGTLGRDYLPSAYDPWLGPRSAGVIRLRYGFDARRLSQRPGAGACEYTPVGLDGQTEAWVRGCLAKPAAASRLAVWRALKRRLYHYDAGVLAFHAFPRNYLLSPAHWEELLAGRPNGGLAAALDVGAGDGSLCSPYARLFGSVTVTELTSPLVWRLKATPTQGASLQAVATAELTPRALGREQFDVAFCLNVLDRCKDPVRMVEQLHALLPPGGWLVVAVVLPWLQSP